MTPTLAFPNNLGIWWPVNTKIWSYQTKILLLTSALTGLGYSDTRLQINCWVEFGQLAPVKIGTKLRVEAKLGERAAAVTIFLFLCPVINHDYFTSINLKLFSADLCGYSLIKLLPPGSINLRPIDLRRQFSGGKAEPKVWPAKVIVHGKLCRGNNPPANVNS